VRLDSPRWEEINPSGYTHEKDGLRALADYLPDADPYHVWANVEFVANDAQSTRSMRWYWPRAVSTSSS
jgi:hypothetical protein